MGERIKVLVVDDHPGVPSGQTAIRKVLPHHEIVGEARDGREALALCAAAPPDVVLMDLLMPGMGGVEATRAIRAQHPSVQVIALTSSTEDEHVREVLEAGAIGYLLKDVSAGDLAAAVRAAREGRPTLAPEATAALVKSVGRPKPPGLELSGRELEVLALMAEGLNNREIGQRLVIGTTTVKFHVSAILGKLGVENRTEAVALAFQRKLVGR
jgi:NarL family two-component system response regulator LiaR